MSQHRRPIVLAVLTVVFLIQLGFQAGRMHGDFVTYWSVAQLIGQNENPYDLVALARVQELARPGFEVLGFWNPPIVLPLIAPFATSYPFARGAWLVFQLLVLALVGIGLHRHYFPARGIAFSLLPFWWTPAYIALIQGQLTPFSLAGIVGYLWFVPRRPALAGLCATLCLLKPHLTAPVLAVIVCHLYQRRAWGGLGGLVAGTLAWVGAATALRPTVWAEWLTASRGSDWLTSNRAPSLANTLTIEFNLPGLPIMVIVVGILGAGLVWYAWRCQAWEVAISGAVLCGLLVSPYHWPYDYLLLLIPLAHMMSKARWATVVVVVLSIVLVVGRPIYRDDYLLWWFTPLVSLVWLVAWRGAPTTD